MPTKKKEAKYIHHSWGISCLNQEKIGERNIKDQQQNDKMTMSQCKHGNLQGLNINSRGRVFFGRFFAWQKTRDPTGKGHISPKKGARCHTFGNILHPSRLTWKINQIHKGSHHLNQTSMTCSILIFGGVRLMDGNLAAAYRVHVPICFFLFYGKSRYLNISVSWISWDMIISNIPESLISLIHPRYLISATTVRHFVDRSPVWWVWGWLKASGRCHLFLGDFSAGAWKGSDLERGGVSKSTGRLPEGSKESKGQG